MDSTSDNILQSGQPSQSALRVAIARAVHQLLDEPIVFDDPLALPVLGRATEQAVRQDPFQFNDPPARSMRAAMVARSRLAEDALHKAVQAGVRQYVVLGAGLDTFSCRNPYRGEGLRTFEVDHPATQHWKQKNLTDAGISVPTSATFVPVDFEHDSLMQRLEASGLQPDAPAYFSWLGVTPYLTEDAVLDTLAVIGKLPARSGITLDYRIPTSMLNPLERLMEEHVANMFAAMGEPWRAAFEPDELQRRLSDFGFNQTESYDPAKLNARYFARRKDGLQSGGGGLRMLCAWT